jgi:hypothetical protein
MKVQWQVTLTRSPAKILASNFRRVKVAHVLQPQFSREHTHGHSGKPASRKATIAHSVLIESEPKL